MSVTKRVGLLAGAATLSLTGASLADVTAGVDTNDQLRNEVDALRAELAEVRAMQSGEFSAERQDQIRGLVQDVLADADTRASLLQGGPTAGHDGHFFLASPDGNYRLNIGGLIQTAFVYNNHDGASTSADEDRWGFEVKRAQLSFWGHFAQVCQLSFFGVQRKDLIAGIRKPNSNTVFIDEAASAGQSLLLVIISKQ